VSDHTKDLGKMFSVLRNYKLKLNPTKCVFGATSRKFLGFLITTRGVEVNPEKIEAIINMSEPRTIHEIQWLAALSRFLTRSAEKSLSFFKSFGLPHS